LGPSENYSPQLVFQAGYGPGSIVKMLDIQLLRDGLRSS